MIPLYRIYLPLRSNGDQPLAAAHHAFTAKLMELAGGYTKEMTVQGAWKNAQGLTVKDTNVPYLIAAPAATFAKVLDAAHELFPDQTAVFATEVGTAFYELPKAAETPATGDVLGPYSPLGGAGADWLSALPVANDKPATVTLTTSPSMGAALDRAQTLATVAAHYSGAAWRIQSTARALRIVRQGVGSPITPQEAARIKNAHLDLDAAYAASFHVPATLEDAA